MGFKPNFNECWIWDSRKLRPHNEKLKNIIINSIEALPYGGDIRITTQIESNNAILTVADDGIGMDESAKLKAFEPLYSTKQGTGRGMGLSIAQSIVSAHNGEIRIDNLKDNGTIVEITIPLVDPEQTALYSVKKGTTRGMPLSSD